MSKKHRIMVLDDDHGVLTALKLTLQLAQYEVAAFSRPLDALAELEAVAPDAILIDLNYSRDTTSGQEGLALLTELRERCPGVPVLVMTAWGSVNLAVEAMKQGAADFIQKPWDNTILLNSLGNQLRLRESLRQQSRLSAENQLLRRHLHAQPELELASQAPGMRRLLNAIEQVASSDANILLTGENGTGKTMLAQYVHRRSTRAERPFVSVDMGSIAENLFESELFGHVKGAFTDARQDRVGRFELAHEGTLFLDEVGNTPLAKQSKLLRVLEERVFERVGVSRSQQCDVRVIAATNADLGQLVERGEFRQDLLYRLNTITLRVPPLRERLEDLPQLINHYLAHYTRKYQKPAPQLTPAIRAALASYHWPGNIRELKHLLERAVLLGQGDALDLELLGIPSPSAPLCAPSSSPQLDFTQKPLASMDELERDIILHRLALHDNQATRAAESLGMSRSAFYRRLEKYRL
ncbi:sigma-54-dependent Fis family transcriptional regulator [Xenophilus sp. AP218F]|nr:sigma-54 dependent transcriptional regulator [Chromobacterium sp. ASV5]OWY37136.1 sigma-54-dependent Fis family transcriptional regulator [Xenophilus sp. AP218F]